MPGAELFLPWLIAAQNSGYVGGGVKDCGEFILGVSAVRGVRDGVIDGCGGPVRDSRVSDCCLEGVKG